ncbi:alpha/beta fold hydrolase [Alcaligenaceae bacterium]|nr:alpha/beta fold hydrolase [Alcaligenaceae bacterium]
MQNINKVMARNIDQQAHAAWAKAWASISPESGALAWVDWAMHLATSPGKRAELSALAMEQHQKLRTYLLQCLACLLIPDGLEQPECVVAPPVNDKRFNDAAWNRWPYNLWHQSFLQQQQWWEQATQGVWGVDPHHQKVVAFAARQWLDIFSPGNWLPTNPVVLQRTLNEKGANLQRGLEFFLDDSARRLAGQPPAGAEAFEVGRNVAVTPGKVVLRNHLIELIQYTPTTKKVRAEPILIVPAWIMKYYILDLSQHNSLIKYMVDQGYTVFCISWKNPKAEDQDLGMDDYLEHGFHAALDAVKAIVPDSKVHATGYCLGGTLLAIAAAAMARDDEGDALASLTLLAAQTDFSEPGELALYIDESQVALLEAQMAQAGYLSGEQMSGAFQMLRTYDLLWSRRLNEYLLGERRPMNDIMAWNADTTRLPAKMHSQYLRRLFLNNDLSAGRYTVKGRPVSLGSLRMPVFSVGTVTDHVAPWKSAYKLHNFSPVEITFALTSGGHNGGIVSPPGHPRRQCQVQTRPFGDDALSPDEWLATAPMQQGSWWPEWLGWLQARSGEAVQPPGMGAPDSGYAVIADAPGDYVKEK